jgi:hypothetical protein
MSEPPEENVKEGRIVSVPSRVMKEGSDTSWIQFDWQGDQIVIRTETGNKLIRDPQRARDIMNELFKIFREA